METFIHQALMSDTSLCDDMISYHKSKVDAKFEYTRPGMTSGGLSDTGKKSTDTMIHPTTSNSVVREYVEHLRHALASYIKKYTFAPKMLHLAEPFNIQHYKPSEAYFGWHTERIAHEVFQRGLVFMTYLNDVSDEGETEWYYQKVKVKPKKGLTVLWPTDFTHVHRGIPSKTQDKFICTGWFHFLDAHATQAHYESILQQVGVKIEQPKPVE